MHALNSNKRSRVPRPPPRARPSQSSRARWPQALLPPVRGQAYRVALPLIVAAAAPMRCASAWLTVPPPPAGTVSAWGIQMHSTPTQQDLVGLSSPHTARQRLGAIMLSWRGPGAVRAAAAAKPVHTHTERRPRSGSSGCGRGGLAYPSPGGLRLRRPRPSRRPRARRRSCRLCCCASPGAAAARAPRRGAPCLRCIVYSANTKGLEARGGSCACCLASGAKRTRCPPQLPLQCHGIVIVMGPNQARAGCRRSTRRRLQAACPG